MTILTAKEKAELIEFAAVQGIEDIDTLDERHYDELLNMFYSSNNQ